MIAFKKNIPLLALAALIPFSGCQRVPDTIEPTLSYAVQDKYLLSLPSPFPPLTPEEKQTDWGKEMQVGFGFAHQLDLYQAITAFKRAQILIPPEEKARSLEIEYEILLCYYMGKKFDEVIHTFNQSQLRYATQEFPAFHDLLTILYESYTQEGMEPESQRFLQAIHSTYPEEGDKLLLSKALTDANLPLLYTFAATPPEKPYLDQFLSDYEMRKKSVTAAQMLNACVPGAGYLYLGQKQSATTAFFLNGLFIAASAYFFHEGNVAAGIIFTSFEAGWYFGGIFGAGLEAKAYNERLYESMATPMMTRQRLFPTLMLNYAF